MSEVGAYYTTEVFNVNLSVTKFELLAGQIASRTPVGCHRNLADSLMYCANSWFFLCEVKVKTNLLFLYQMLSTHPDCTTSRCVCNSLIFVIASLKALVY